MLIITGSGQILSSTLISEDDDVIPGISFEVIGRTDADDADTEFHAILDSLVGSDRTRAWRSLIEAATKTNRVVYCHFSGFATIMPNPDARPRYHIHSFFVAPDISAIAA